MDNELEKKLIDQLEKMPSIVDDMDGNALYNQISLRLSEENVPKRKRKTKIIIPLLATAAVLFFLVSLPFLLNSVSDQTTSLNEASEDRADIMITEESSSSFFDSEESFDKGGDEAELMKEGEDSPNSHEAQVVEVVDSQSQILHLAIYDDQLQYVIPISFILPKDADLEDYYNDLSNILASENILPEDYLLEGLKFELDFEKREVLLNIPEDFTLGDGTARAGIFQQLLEEMFSPYGFRRVIFTSNENVGVQLGPFGTLTELDIPENRYASYLIYKEQYFVPISQETTTSINKAIESLETDISDFNITHTIPENVSFEIAESQSNLNLTYTGSENKEDLLTTTTIESILLTAKSYGYEHVLFQNMPVNSLGIYDFSNPIGVPIGVNLIDHTN